MKIIVRALLILFFPLASLGQSCCSGGVPLSSNLGLPPSEGKALQLNLAYDLNVLETLKTGRRQLDDASRSRRTHSLLLEAGYSFTEHFAVDALFSWVRQERQIEQFGSTDLTSTEGPGDVVLLFKYRALHFEKIAGSLFLGLGTKLPTGPSGLRSRQGITLNADLQPGSGAWDGILWANWSHNLKFRPSMSFSATTAYSHKGRNTEYLGNQTYQFGQEWQLMASLSDRLFIARAIIDPSLLLRYRQVQADEQNGERVPSTGGQWVFINPGFTYWIQPDISFNANVSLPLFADITGTQATPTFRINLGFYHLINFKQSINPLP